MIGNCTLNKLIAMLENGWRIKRMIYRGFRDGEPCWTVEEENAIVCLATRWFEFRRNDFPRCFGDKDCEGGFNEIIFERPDKTQ